MVAIQTKYIAPTTNRVGRIKAFTEHFSVTIPYNGKLNFEHVHFEAVKALVKKHDLDWDISKMAFGGTKDGYVFCFPYSIIES